MPSLYGFSNRRDIASAIKLSRELHQNPRWRRYAHLKPEIVSEDGGGGSSFLARAYTQLPARADDDTLGGPTTVKKCSIGALGSVTEGDDVDVWSWVQSTSADPADDPKGYIYVWIEEDENGRLCWTGEDCPVIDPPVLQTQSGSDTIIGDVWTPLTGVSFNVTREGTYQFIYDATFNVTVAPNTTYGIGIRTSVDGVGGTGKFIYNERGSSGLETFSGSFFFEPPPANLPSVITVEAIDQTGNINPLDYIAAQSEFQIYGPF